VCFSNVDVVLVVNSANGPFGLLTKIFRKKTCINVDGLEWLRPKWNGIGSIYFKFASKLATIFYDEIITDSIEMSKVYEKKFYKKSNVIAYGHTMIKSCASHYLKKYNLKNSSYYLIVGRLIPDNNSKIIVESFIRSKNKKKLIVVGDVPYSDKYANDVKSLGGDNIVFTGYINNQEELSCLYKNCYGYIHGHEYGGTNPTMINALSFNCQILALNTPFNREMLYGKNVLFFEKDIFSVSSTIELFESIYNQLEKENLLYNIPEKYNWDFITSQYLNTFKNITNFHDK